MSHLPSTMWLTALDCSAPGGRSTYKVTLYKHDARRPAGILSGVTRIRTHDHWHWKEHSYSYLLSQCNLQSDLKFTDLYFTIVFDILQLTLLHVRTMSRLSSFSLPDSILLPGSHIVCCIMGFMEWVAILSFALWDIIDKPLNIAFSHLMLPCCAVGIIKAYFHWHTMTLSL